MFAFFAAVIWIRRRSDPRPQVRYRDLPPLAQKTFFAGWLLGVVGIVGASVDERFELALLPGGALLVVAGAALRNFRTAARVNPRAISVGTIVIGIAWGAIGVAQLVDLLG